MSKLEDELKEEQRKKAEAANPPAKPSVQQEMADTKAQIDAFHLKMELESIQAGYENFKLRESSLEGKESILLEAQKKLDDERNKFEVEQADRVATHNAKVSEYNQQYQLLQTKLKEADKRQEETLKDQAKALAIVKHQTAKEKADNEKLQSYESNMTEALEIFGEMGAILRKQSDTKCYNLGKIIGYDASLISRIQENKGSLFSIADIITAEVGRINELCEYLQSQRNTEKLVNYLMSNTDWLEDRLKIAWEPAGKETLKG